MKLSVMLIGFCAAAIGDWLLAVQGAPRGTIGFLGGVAAFACAQVLWTLAHTGEARVNIKAFAAMAIPLELFVCVRLWPVLGLVDCVAVSIYALTGALNVAMAYSTRRIFYFMGALMLVASDVCIGLRWLQLPEARILVGPMYVTAELLLMTSCFVRRGARFDLSAGSAARSGIFTVLVSGSLFALAAHIYPGGGYNPCMRMLSALGRSSVRMVEFPWSHLLFMVAMIVSAYGVVRVSRQRGLCAWGTALNAAGLLAIALIPEDVSMIFHNAGCWMAAAGGGLMFFVWLCSGGIGRNEKRLWCVVLLTPIATLGITLALHVFKVLPFAPYSPTAQKFVIMSFALWILHIAARHSRMCIFAYCALGVPVMLFCVPKGSEKAPESSDAATLAYAREPQIGDEVRVPMTEDERAGFAWLEYVTGELSDVEEKEWWATGGSQHGIFAKRYNIAFAGYAAAALGARGGDVESRARAGRIIGNCIKRMLRTDVWAYSQSKSYWGRKPWAPDPCHRENVMYTGHLLHLLAYYELFTGDTRYHRKGGGWDFVWKDGRSVHYDVEKLIDVTVEQMRKGPNGGIACEPGLMFFACNNHPHVALSVFKKLGYGDWTAEAVRWEKWALAHYTKPKLGSGALSLVYHVRSGLMYPRAQNAHDAWSCLWYAAWASDYGKAKALWSESSRCFDDERCDMFERTNSSDEAPKGDCCDPQPVAFTVTTIFREAAARACGDIEMANYMAQKDQGDVVRESGRLWLRLNREWRIGATAIHLISLAESNGFNFRLLTVTTTSAH